MAEIQDLDPIDANNVGRWPEGMLGGAINNAGRADEGILARWFRDTNGSIAASGAANAFAITSVRTIPALIDNLVMAFTANHTITGAATLNLNGLGAKDIKRFNGSSLTAGDIVSGTPVVVIYKLAADDWFMVSAAAALFANMHADFNENATPGNPAANVARLYTRDDAGQTQLAYRDSAGVVFDIPGKATQAQMEAASETRFAVTPGRQHFHPGHPKASVIFDQVGTQTVLEDYGVTSLTDEGVGQTTITFDTTFSGTSNYGCTGGFARGPGADFDHGLSARGTDAKTTTTFRVIAFDTNGGAGEDSSEVGVVFTGDQ